jgi:AcrR family transcriptional regulator
MRERILETASQHFFQAGFARVSMDDLAAAMGISKKTLYKHFPGKEEILRQVMARRAQQIESAVQSVLQNPKLNSLSRSMEIFALMARRLSQTGQPFIQDMKKYAPHIWSEVDAHRTRIIRNSFARLVEEGIREKNFREDVDPHLVMLIYLAAVQQILNPETLSTLPFTLGQAFEGIIKVLLEGVLTSQARRQMRKKNPLEEVWDQANSQL